VTPVARGVLAFVLVAGAGPAGFLIYHAVFDSHPLHHGQTTAPQGDPEPGSAPASAPGTAPALPQTTVPGEADPAIPPTQTTSTHGPVPLTLPAAVVLPDSNGKLHHLSEYRGHPLVLNFWATWCEPCRREIPLLESLHQERRDSVQIIGVAVDFQADVLKYAQAHGVTYPLLMGEQNGLAAVNALGMDTAFPFTVFADSLGRIVAVKRGELHADEAGLILGEVTAIDAGKIGLDQARSAISSGLRSLAIARAQQSATAPATAGAKS
jgi:thiol-disulfide isomerase/thioredoxin